MKMLKASASRGVVVPVDVVKIKDGVVYPKAGGPDQITNGYIHFFADGKVDEAMKWINHQRKRWGMKLLTRKEIENG